MLFLSKESQELLASQDIADQQDLQGFLAILVPKELLVLAVTAALLVFRDIAVLKELQVFLDTLAK